jgi:hypothetical protein
LDYAELAIVTHLEKDPEWATILCETFVGLRRGKWTDDYVELITDRWGGALTFGDVYSFIQIHTMLGLGKIVMAKVGVGSTPSSDRQVERNDRALQQLPPPFEAKFWGGNADSDGYVRWREPIEMNVVVDGSERRGTVAPAQVPLEVGHTNGSTTLLHVNGEHGLARWPYGSTEITLMHLIDE